MLAVAISRQLCVCIDSQQSSVMWWQVISVVEHLGNSMQEKCMCSVADREVHVHNSGKWRNVNALWKLVEKCLGTVMGYMHWYSGQG